MRAMEVRKQHKHIFPAYSLPSWAPVLVGVVAVAAAILVVSLIGGGITAVVVLGTIFFGVALPTWSRLVEGSP